MNGINALTEAFLWFCNSAAFDVDEKRDQVERQNDSTKLQYTKAQFFFS